MNPQPFKCPVCLGSGIDQFILVSNSLPDRIRNPCHVCDGKGIIWGPEDPDAWLVEYGWKTK